MKVPSCLVKVLLVLGLVFHPKVVKALDSFTTEFESFEVKQNGVFGKLFIPKKVKTSVIVIVLGGSSGGIRVERSSELARRGFVSFALGYFRYADLPNTLDNIPVETVSLAIDYLKSKPNLTTTKIVIWGASRGSELAFLAASLDSRVKGVIASSPSKVAWHGARTDNAWTFEQQPVPSLTFNKRSDQPIYLRASNALSDNNLVAAAQFKFERINGPILLFSGQNDNIWPSHTMADDIAQYLRNKQHPFAVIHHSYDTGHSFNDKAIKNIYKRVTHHLVTNF